MAPSTSVCARIARFFVLVLAPQSSPSVPPDPLPAPYSSRPVHRKKSVHPMANASTFWYNLTSRSAARMSVINSSGAWYPGVPYLAAGN